MTPEEWQKKHGFSDEYMDLFKEIMKSKAVRLDLENPKKAKFLTITDIKPNVSAESDKTAH